jgi:hypothetical protein
VAAVMPGLYYPEMLPRVQEINSPAVQSGFADVVAVDRGGQIQFAKAYRLANRAR